MKIDEIKTIVQMMSEHDLTEFKIESQDMHLCIRRGLSANSVPQIVQTVPAIVAPQPLPAAVQASGDGVKKENGQTVGEPVKRETINSPIVGTFYKSSSPDSEPFVKIGSSVTPDSVVCIIEAMKVMNEIKAERNGIIKEILVDNGRPVEFGQPMFVLE